MLPECVENIINEYADEYVLRDWIDPNKLYLPTLCTNENATSFIINNRLYEKLSLSEAHSFIKNLVKKETRSQSLYKAIMKKDIYSDKIYRQYHRYYWREMSALDTDVALYLIRNNLHFVNWSVLSRNPNDEVIDIIQDNIHLVSWYHLHMNDNPRAFEILKSHPDRININLLIKHGNDEALRFVQPQITLDTAWYLQSNPHLQAAKILYAIPCNYYRHDFKYSPYNAGYLFNIEHDTYRLVDSGVNTSEVINIIVNNAPNIHWDHLWNGLFKTFGATNTEIYRYIPDNLLKIKSRWASMNAGLIDEIKEDPSLIVWKSLSHNTHEYAMELLKKNQDKIAYGNLSKNPSIFVLNKKNISKVMG